MNKIKFTKKITMLIVLCLIVNFMFFNCRNNSNQMYADMYGYDGNIDIVFCGSSVVQYGCNPDVADKLLQQNTFNAGTSAQLLQGSYYLIKEIAKQNTIKTLFLSMLFSTQQTDNANIASTYILSRGMKNSINKYEYLWDAGKIDGMINTILPVLNSHINPIVAINNKLNGTNKWPQVCKQGFLMNTSVIDENTIFDTVADIDPLKPMSGYSYQYLLEITKYCKANNIELILVGVPLPDATLVNEKYYEEYIQFVKKYTEEQNIKYWDFNLSKETFFTMDSSGYADATHLNVTGANKFTESLCNLYLDIKSGNITEKEVFYDTYEEKLEFNMDDTCAIK